MLQQLITNKVKDYEKEIGFKVDQSVNKEIEKALKGYLLIDFDVKGIYKDLIILSTTLLNMGYGEINKEIKIYL